METKEAAEELVRPYGVIDESLIRVSVQEEAGLELLGKSEPRGVIASDVGGRKRQEDLLTSSDERKEEDPVRIRELTALRLSFKNILQIDNLVGLLALHTLYLDNNAIEEIQNIGHLVNLQWLDLSFNSISEIKGLEKLTNLRDLSLFSNNISVIENIDQCTNLECFSIGKNRISKLDNLLKLRPFKKLRCVTLEENPVCDDPEYRMFVLAFLGQLKYLDNSVVDEKEVVSAREQFQDELLEAQERDKILEENERVAKLHEDHVARLQGAGLEILDSLFHSMFVEDTEFERLKGLPGFEAIYEIYEEQYRVLLEGAVTGGMELYNRYSDEISRFETAGDKFCVENDLKSREIIGDFQKIASADERAKKREDVKDELMTIEMEQVQQLKKLLDVFENRAGAIKSERVDHATQFFRKVEELENSYATTLENLAQNLLDQLSENLLEDLSDELLAFLSDKDALFSAIQSSHDVHMEQLLAKEDVLRDGIIHELTSRVGGLKKSFAALNRERVFELSKLCKELP